MAVRVALTMRTTDSMTGTSTSTPTSQRSSGLHAEQADGRCDCELEEVARPDQCGRRGHAPSDVLAPAEPVGQAGIQVDLDKDRDGEYGVTTGCR